MLHVCYRALSAIGQIPELDKSPEKNRFANTNREEKNVAFANFSRGDESRGLQRRIKASLSRP
jgi:hypothetical protein